MCDVLLKICPPEDFSEACHMIRKIVLNKKHKHLSKGMKRKEVWKEGGNKNGVWGRGNSLRYLNFK